MTSFQALVLLLMTPLVPFALALAVLRWRASRALQTAAALAALPALVTSALMPAGIASTLPWLLAGSEVGLDATGRPFLFFSAAIWLAAGLHARQSIEGAKRSRFFVPFLLVMSGNLGLIIARDILAFYLFFVLMSFAAYGLVVHDASDEARRAGRIYMILVVAGDMMLFAALVLAALEAEGALLFEIVRQTTAASAYRDAIIALVVAGFGVKAGVIGLHVTLPLVYRAAPTPAAAALAGAMINAGLLGWLRFLPFGAELSAWGALLIAAGAAAVFYAALVGVTQRDAASVLAYSSVSQMGIMTAGAGAALAAAEHSAAIIAAVTVYAMHHAFAKSALFLGTGLAARPARGRRSAMALRTGLLLPALALAGAPLTSGMLAKEHLKESLGAAAAPAIQTLATLLPWTAFATTLILARFLWIVWPRDAPAATAPGPTLRRTLPWMMLLLLTAAGVWVWPLENPPRLYAAAVFWETMWPVILGASVAAAFGRAAASQKMPTPRIPAGDIVVIAERVARRAAAAWQRAAYGGLPTVRDALRRALGSSSAGRRWSRFAIGAETLLGQWRVALPIFIATAVALIAAAMWS